MDEGQNIKDAVHESMGEFFTAQSEKERFISTQRIPFICKDISDMKKDLKDILDSISTSRGRLETKMEEVYVTKESFQPVRTIVYGVVALTLVAVFTALLALVILTKSHA